MNTIEIYADTRSVGRCRDNACGKRILWAEVVATGKKMCFDDTELVAIRTRYSPDRRLIEEVDLDENHWKSCPGAANFKKRK